MRYSAILICVLMLAALAAPVLATTIDAPQEPIIGGVTLAPVETTKEPTKEPTAEPTREPTKAPTPEPTREPTAEPTMIHPVTRETAEPTKTPSGPEVGWVSITSTPSGSRVTLDGKTRGMTPLVGVEMGAGITHDIAISHEGYVTYRTTVTLGNGEETAVDADLVMEPVPEPTKTPTREPTTEPTRVPTTEPTKEPIGAGKGWIRVNSNVNGATASFDELSSGCTIESGSCTVEVSVTGTPFKKFTVQKPGYVTFTGAVTSWPTDGQTINVYSTLNPVPVPTLGNIQVTSYPSGAVATLDGGSWQYTPCTFSSVSSGTNHVVQVSLNGYETYTTTVWVSPGQTYPVSITLTPNPPQSGSLSITSEPRGADIYVDGQYRGYTPSVIPGLVPGRHTVRVQKAGYDEYITTVSVSAGQRTPVSVTLARLPANVGSIEATSNPAGAALYLDGNYMGTTPAGDYFDLTSLTPGYHTITMKLTDYQDYTQVVTVQAGGVATVRAQLLPLAPGPVPDTTGEIAVSSSPAGARVLLDNVFRGVTPLTLSDITTGSHLVTITEQGYQDSTQTIMVTGGQVTPVTVALAEVTPTPTQKSPATMVPVLGAVVVIGAVLVLRRK
jgi:hypothetical protein